MAWDELAIEVIEQESNKFKEGEFSPPFIKQIKHPDFPKREVIMKTLADMPPKEEHRDLVMDVMLDAIAHMQHRGTAMKVLRAWATEKYADHVVIHLRQHHRAPFYPDELLDLLAEFKTKSAIEFLVDAVENHSFTANKYLIQIGSGCEAAILKILPKAESPHALALLMDVLQKVGTKQSLPLLVRMTSSTDGNIAGKAHQTIQEIKKRIGG